MYRPLSTVSLPGTALQSLQDNGFYYFEDVVSHRGVSPEAQNILHPWSLHTVDSWQELTSPPLLSNSLDIWQQESTSPKIVTWSEALDNMLGGGVPIEAITEFCGAPGSGKTQLCLQLCVDVQIPKFLGGVGGQAIYIDTDSNFSPHRVREIAEACCKHCQLLSDPLDDSQTNIMKNFDPSSILNGINIVTVHGVAQLLAAIKLLPNVLEQNPLVQLIVVDSLAFPFHCGDSCTTIDRTSYLYRILSDLQRLAVQKKLAVVVTNHLTTRVIRSGDTKSELLPSLGESFAHRVNTRILLGRVPGNYIAAILRKGNDQFSSSAKFQVMKEGVRD